MDKKSIENHLKSAMSQATPNVLDDILAMNPPQDKVHIVEMRTFSRAKMRMISSLAAACLMVILFAGGFQIYGTHYRIVSVVELDVNPSIEMQVNSVDKVLSTKALNIDGEGILDGMDLKGIDIKVAVNAVIGSMAQQGYLDEEESSILVSVTNKDETKADNLRQEVVSNIEASLEQNQVSAVVFNQQVTPSQELEELAKEYEISNGKAGFIQNLVEKEESLTFEELAPLSMSEINRVINEKEIEVEDLKEVPLLTTTEETEESSQDEGDEDLSQKAEYEESESSLEGEVDLENTEASEEHQTEAETEPAEATENQPEQMNNINIRTARYEDDVIWVEFEGKVSWKNPTVSVQGEDGQLYPAMLVSTASNYCEIYAEGLSDEVEYTFTIGGIKARRGEQFDTIIGKIIANIPETTSPDIGISEPNSESDVDKSDGFEEVPTTESKESEESLEEEQSLEPLESESDEEESAESTTVVDQSSEESSEELEESLEETDDDTDEEFDEEDEEAKDETEIEEEINQELLIPAIPRVSITNIVYQSPDLVEIVFSKEVEWLFPEISIVDNNGKEHVVVIMAMGRRGCILNVDTLEAGNSYTIRIGGIAETASTKTTEVVGFLTIVNQ